MELSEQREMIWRKKFKLWVKSEDFIAVHPALLEDALKEVAQLESSLAEAREEIERLREFARLAQVEWTVLESAESEGVVRVEYPCAVHIKMKDLVKHEALNLPTNG